ncbi:MAG: hypothetical protein ACUVXA_06500 [Candidatus Jordarchaeum sp.]|uniref:hypothetical protein n=1 Tax=Candidatus Jordarchaeum sp. TaxID=2823881 RepID=UPI00404A1A10
MFKSTSNFLTRKDIYTTLTTLSTMTTKSIKLSEETYKKLVEVAGRLQAEWKRSVSIEDAIKYLMRRKISDLAGSWDVSDEEVREIKESLRKGWRAWRRYA